MALSSAQQASRLFKKSLGVAETITTKEFFSEGKLGRTSVFPSQLWTDSALIPDVAPTLSDGGVFGVVEYHSKLSLQFIPGSVSGGRDVSYSGETLKNAIPFNYGDGSSYGYKLYTSADVVISDGVGDWLVDSEAGVLTFYTPSNIPVGVSAGSPPKISFYKYVGNTGLTTITSDVSTEISNRETADSLLSTTISTESSTRLSTDNLLSTTISTESSTRLSVVNSMSTIISSSLSTESSTRLSTDNLLSTTISSEVSSRESTDISLSTALLNIVYDSAYSDSIAVASTIGGIVSGTLIGTLTGKTFSNLFDDILVPTVLPSVTTPISVTFNGISTTNVEVGTQLSPSVTTTYNPGTITNGNGSVGPNLVGPATLYTFRLPNLSTDGTPSSTSTHTYSTPVTIGLSTYQWSVETTYSAGTGLYYDNKMVSRTNLDGQRVQSTVTGNSGIITGLNRRYWGTSSKYPFTLSTDVTGLVNSELSGTRNKSYSINGNGQYLYYCYPSRLGSATFTIGTNVVIFNRITISVTNGTAVPFTEDFYVYSSPDIQFGTGINITVS